jgi:hypothetical protein
MSCRSTGLLLFTLFDIGETGETVERSKTNIRMHTANLKYEEVL